jgi:rod shape-determining protein MreD
MALAIQRRLLWFSLREQALQIVPLFIIAALLEWATRLIVQDAWPHWSQLFAPFLQAALWPLVGAVLLAPQRRAFAPDDIRPL